MGQEPPLSPTPVEWELAHGAPHLWWWVWVFGTVNFKPKMSAVEVIFSLSFISKDALCVEEKPPLPSPPAPAAPSKPPRPTKPRPKSRVSRYRSSSSQRARRQRQALAQQAAAATAAAVAATPSSTEQSGGLEEEGPEGRYSAEHVHREGSLGSHLLDGDSHGLNCISRANVRYPKTKKVINLHSRNRTFLFNIWWD